MTNSEIAVLTFPLAGAVVVAGIVWLATTVSVRGFHRRPAFPANAILSDINDKLGQVEVVQTSTGTWYRIDDADRDFILGSPRLNAPGPRTASKTPT